MNETTQAGAVATEAGAVPVSSGEAAWQPEIPALAVADDGWQVTTPAPWRRYFGRMFDLTVIGALAWICIGFVLAFVDAALYDRLFAEDSLVNNLLVSAILTCILVVPVLAVVTGTTGGSPGKWLFGTRITRHDGRPIGVAAAFRRELGVLVRGLAFGLPLISLGTVLMARSSLDEYGTTWWDRGKPWVVTHREQGPLQVALFVLGLVVWFAVRLLLQAIA